MCVAMCVTMQDGGRSLWKYECGRRRRKKREEVRLEVEEDSVKDQLQAQMTGIVGLVSEVWFLSG